MNPLDAVNDDEQFTVLLAHYIEGEIEGDDNDPANDSSLSPELRLRLQRALDCLHRLRQIQMPACPAEKPDLQMSPSEDPITLDLPGEITLGDGATVRQVGRFRILRTLGGGGGGIVFLAYDPQLRREVALKIPRLDALVTPVLRQRFVRETRAAAGLDHPNLVPVYEAGEANGLCFLVSAYCRGGSLADWLKQRTTPVRVRLAAESLAVLADAVQYVHEHGIVHRDLKPGNILLDPIGTRPDGGLSFSPRLTDFGLAKLREGQTELTRSGVMLGTPSYMAPEQAEGRLHDIGPTTDVYGLGAVLYELLTGRPPFRGIAEADTLRQVLADEPISPRRLRPDVPRDLEIICLKCLEKEPTRRYASAAELADDLRRFLAHEPIRARALGRTERLRKWVRRHPLHTALLACGLLIALGLVAGELRLAWIKQGHDADRALTAIQHEEHQQHNERRLRRHHYAEDIGLAWHSWNNRRLEEMAVLLDRHRSGDGADNLRGFEWYYLAGLSRAALPRMQHSAHLYCLAFSPDGMTCASGHQDNSVVLWNPASGRRRKILDGHKLHVYALAYSPDGKYLASGSGSGENDTYRGELLLWDAKTDKVLLNFPEILGAVDSLAFSPDGLTLAASIVNPKTSAGNHVKIWAIPSGTLRASIPFSPTESVVSIAFSADSTKLACGHFNGKTSLYDAKGGPVLETWLGHDRCVWSVTCGRKSDALVSGGHDGKVRLCSLRTGGSLLGEYRHKSEVWAVALSPDERSVASVSHDGVVKLWDRVNQCERFSWTVPGKGRAVAFSPNGKTLAVGIEDGRVWMFDLFPTAETLSWLGHRDGKKPHEAWAVAFSPDCNTLASAGDDHMIRLWDAANGRERAVLRGHQSLVTSLAYSPDGKWLASGSFDDNGPVKLWDTAKGTEVATLNGHNHRVDSVVFSPDGKLLATAGRDRTVRLWDVASRKEQQVIAGHRISSLAFAPDGRTLAMGGDAQTVLLWDVDGKRERWTLDSHPPGHVTVAYSPDGKTLTTGDTDGTLRFWDTATGKLRLSVRRHRATVNCLAYSPDGKTLASASFDKKTKLWQTATGRELLTLPEQNDRVRWVAFSTDAAMLATAGHDGVVKIYRAGVPTPSRNPTAGATADRR